MMSCRQDKTLPYDVIRPARHVRQGEASRIAFPITQCDCSTAPNDPLGQEKPEFNNTLTLANKSVKFGVNTAVNYDPEKDPKKVVAIPVINEDIETD